MSYALLKNADQDNLRAERLAALEADHFRNELVLEDAGSPEEAEHARRMMDDLTRRMTVHRAKLGLNMKPGVDQTIENAPAPAEAEAPPVESGNGTVSGNIGVSDAVSSTV